MTTKKKFLYYNQVVEICSGAPAPAPEPTPEPDAGRTFIKFLKFEICSLDIKKI